MAQSIAIIQARLATLGYDPGPADGVPGRRTQGAIRAFQRDQMLAVDGIAGPLTRARLFPDGRGMAGPADHPWFEEARRLIGTREVPGSASNPTIEDWATGLGIPYRSDDIPWCGLFVAYCIGSTLADEPLPVRPLAARSWLRFGRACPPRPGCVLVFWRAGRESGKGHVGFHAGEDADGFHVLGGNQSDAVNVKRLPKAQFLGARWPATVAEGAAGPTALGTDGDAFETALG